MRWYGVLIVTLWFTVASQAWAGEYRCKGYTTITCAEHIRDIVIEKFTTKFPANLYTIVVISDYDAFTNGGGVGFALAGVSPRVTEKKYGELAYMPLLRFKASRRDVGSSVTPAMKRQFEIGLLRTAVADLMEYCETDENCDVLQLSSH